MIYKYVIVSKKDIEFNPKLLTQNPKTKMIVLYIKDSIGLLALCGTSK